MVPKYLTSTVNHLLLTIYWNTLCFTSFGRSVFKTCCRTSSPFWK